MERGLIGTWKYGNRNLWGEDLGSYGLSDSNHQMDGRVPKCIQMKRRARGKRRSVVLNWSDGKVEGRNKLRIRDTNTRGNASTSRGRGNADEAPSTMPEFCRR